MKYRTLGRTNLLVSELGFGCGAVGGLLVKGKHQEMVRVVARAIELGVNYFDTARIYGDGKSETNLGLVLEELGADVRVGTKVRLTAADMEHIESAIIESVEGSLRRLRRECIDLIQLHNPIALRRHLDRGWMGVDDIEPAIDTFRYFQEKGKVRFWGINGLGETKALHQVIAAGTADTIQSCYNLLNPTSGMQAPAEFPFQDYQRLIDKAAENQMGVIAIRVLAGGALSGTATRHPNAAQSVAPIASGRSFAEDVERAKAFDFLAKEGYTDHPVEAAIRFVISKAEVSTALVGISNMEQLEQAVVYVNRGPLPTEALNRLAEVWPAIWRAG